MERSSNSPERGVDEPGTAVSGPSLAATAILIGPPGSGKTTVGAALASLWGTQLRDTDHMIEESVGKPIADIFVDDGEARFREWERDTVLAAIADLRAGIGPRVVALGGGAPMNVAVQEALEGLPVVFLDVSLAQAAPRVGLSGARPLLAVNPRATWQRLYAERRPTYERLATITLSTDDVEPGTVAESISRQLAQAPAQPPEPVYRDSRRDTAPQLENLVTIEVGGPSPYPVLIGAGALDSLGAALPPAARRCLLIAGPTTGGAADKVEAWLRLEAGEGAEWRGAASQEPTRELTQETQEPRLEPTQETQEPTQEPRLERVARLDVTAGEEAKELGQAAAGWDAAADAGLTRSDVIVAVGGGSVTDLAGFVAATWLRGIAVLQVPTTLLAMVDAAVGGKTGINTAAGKNLVGSFHPPTGVLCDLGVLASLPEAELRSGLAEVAKCGLIADPAILTLLARLPDAEATAASPSSIGEALRAQPEVLAELVTRAVAVKAEVVTKDLKEAGPREALNFGHTLGHAIERAEHYRMRHGEAIAIGMVFAAALAAASGRAPSDVVDTTRTLMARLGLPVRYEGPFAPLLEAMRLDKKARASHLRFVIVPEVGHTDILTDPSPEALAQAAAAVGLA